MFTRCKRETREQWLKERGKGIGGSDAPVVLGLSKWKTNVELYREKISNTNEVETENSFTRYGHLCEPAIREIFKADFEDVMDVYYQENEILIKNDEPYMRASLDGELYVKKDFWLDSYHRNNQVSESVHLKAGQKGVLEIKTFEVTSHSRNMEWNENIPYDYYIQTLHCLYVTNYDFVILRVKLRYKVQDMYRHEIRDYVYTKNEKKDDIAIVSNAVREFWQDHVEKKKEPFLIIRGI